MITIPTGDLTGLLNDVIPFACPNDDFPTLNTVRLEWDSSMLHALATDRQRIGIASWHPDDEPFGKSDGDDLFAKWGGADDRWSAIIPFTDAKAMTAAFKLTSKEQRVPLTVDFQDGRVKVMRSRDTGHAALTMVVESQLVDYPDVRKLLAECDRITPVNSLAYGAAFLADFAKVRARGPLELTFTGTTGLTHVTIGERFVGGIIPTRMGDEREREPARV